VYIHDLVVHDVCCALLAPDNNDARRYFGFDEPLDVEIHQ
jgi:hypothetical protein